MYKIGRTLSEFSTPLYQCSALLFSCATATWLYISTLLLQENGPVSPVGAKLQSLRTGSLVTDCVPTSSLSTMVYSVQIYVNGGCRRNGRPDAIGVAAAAIKNKYGKHHAWTRSLPLNPAPTNQRTEIESIILGLQKVLAKFQRMHTAPWFDVTVYSDSKFAVKCMTNFVYKWLKHGWVTCAGYEVANRDLLEEALDLDTALKEIADVRYVWIPRKDNWYADKLCNLHLDSMESIPRLT